MKTNKPITILLMACVTVFLLTCPAWSANTIKIGVIGPMQFVQGKGHWNGATLAADQINAKGGVNVGGKMMKVELVKADSNIYPDSLVSLPITAEVPVPCPLA